MEALHDVLKNKTPTPTKSGPERRISTRKRSISSPGTRSRTSPSPAKKQRGSPDELALKEPVPSPHRRRSLRRSVRNNRRRTLPSIHDNAADLSKAIGFELPESDRLSELLQSCFQFSVKKLEDSLNNADGFNQESFRLKASSVRQKLKRFTERLSRDGTLKKCTEQPISFESNPEAEALKEQIKECISKFSHEGQKWDELLEDYKQKAEELSRGELAPVSPVRNPNCQPSIVLDGQCSKKRKQFTENKFPEAQSASVSQLPTSQDNIIHSKPDYRSLLNQQGAVFDCMELVLDELQESMQLLNSFLEDTTQHLQTMSTQLKSQSFKPVEDSPVRKFLKLPQK